MRRETASPTSHSSSTAEHFFLSTFSDVNKTPIQRNSSSGTNSGKNKTSCHRLRAVYVPGSTLYAIYYPFNHHFNSSGQSHVMVRWLRHKDWKDLVSLT